MTSYEKAALDSNEQMVRRRFAELDKRNFRILDELFDKAYVLHFPGLKAPMNLDATRRFYETLYSAFPDLTHTIDEQITARDKVVTRWTARGTHRGDFMKIPPTGKSISLTGINIYTVTNGKLSESHVEWDLLDLFRQLGAVTLPEWRP